MTERHGLYLTVGRTLDGRMVAVCADGTLHRGHRPVTILSVEAVETEAEAKEWFERVILERPWETRQ